jgi:hypothetical protein
MDGDGLQRRAPSVRDVVEHPGARCAVDRLVLRLRQAAHVPVQTGVPA